MKPHPYTNPTPKHQAKHTGLKERVALIKGVEVDIVDQLEEYARVGKRGVGLLYVGVGEVGGCGCWLIGWLVRVCAHHPPSVSLTHTRTHAPPLLQVKGENEAKAAHWEQELSKLRKAHEGMYALVVGWLVGWLDGSMDGWMDGWMDGESSGSLVIDRLDSHSHGLSVPSNPARPIKQLITQSSPPTSNINNTPEDMASDPTLQEPAEGEEGADAGFDSDDDEEEEEEEEQQEEGAESKERLSKGRCAFGCVLIGGCGCLLP